MSEPFLEFDCRFRYRAQFRLDARFSLPTGISALLGASGSGKSTCLHLIAGLLKPGSGSIRLGQAVLVDREAGGWVPAYRRRLGVVFQDHLLFPHLTVAGNLRYGMPKEAGARDGAGDGGGGRGSKVRFDQVVEVLELGGLLERYPAQLSGGQQRRVAMGRALLRQPDLLLMDEPLTGLDESLRDRVLASLQRIHEQWALPILLVSHEQVAVRRLAQHVVVLDAGKVVAEGSVAQALDRITMKMTIDHAGPVNVLRIQEVKRSGEICEGSLAGQRFFFVGKTDEQTAYVRCLPHDVALARDRLPPISMRNQLCGRVRDIVKLNGSSRVYVGVDVGTLLWSEITAAALDELGLDVGQPVTCLLKAAAAEWIG